jgi:MFS family permease
VNDLISSAPGEPAATDRPWPSPRQAWYAVGIFALALMVNFLDRGIVGLLVQPIKRDLHLSDFRISLIIGFAFVCMYVILGLPIARMVDVRSRRVILTCGITAWSIATTLCGLAQNFWQLFLARIGVGAGESCSGPATFSMMADLFPPRKLPRAIAVLNFGFIAGTGMSLLAGGAAIAWISSWPSISLPLIGELYDWQLVFIVVGLPGFIVAALMMTVTEPIRRGIAVTGPNGQPQSIPIREVVRYLLQHRTTYAPMFIGVASSTVLAFGGQAWHAAFFARTYGWSAPQFATIFGIAIVILGPFVLIAGSMLAERFARQGRLDANLRVTLLAAVLTLVPTLLYPFMPTPQLAIALVILGFLAGMLTPGPYNAALQIVTPNQMRGQVTALFLFVFNIVGFGLGATIVATFTNFVFGDENMLRYSLAATAAVMGPISIACFWLGLKPYARSVERMGAHREVAVAPASQ